MVKRSDQIMSETMSYNTPNPTVDTLSPYLIEFIPNWVMNLIAIPIICIDHTLSYYLVS